VNHVRGRHDKYQRASNPPFPLSQLSFPQHCLFAVLLQDTRYALRGLRRSRAFSAAVILTLGLGIGANVAMFGIVDRLMFRPFAFLRDPATVHQVYLRNYDRGRLRTNGSFEYTIYEDLKRWTTSFSQLAAFAHQTNAVGVGDVARERRVAQVSATFFEFFDAKPALGRFFTRAEDTVPRGADVAVLGYAFWQSEYGGRDVLGEVLHVGNIAATIIGVAPEGFAGVNDADPPAVYIPITTYAGAQPSQAEKPTYYTRYNWGWMNVIVRRKAGITVEQASLDATQSYGRSWETMRAQEPRVTPIDIARPFAHIGGFRAGAGPDPGLEARTAIWVSGVAVIVLLIACANVGNLFVARALRQQRETAVRLALGVNRQRLMMQSLVESVTLALIGSVVGLVIAHWGGAAIRRLLIATQGTSLDVFTDWRTLGAATGVALVSGILTGLLPALLSGRGDLTASLKAGARSGTYQRSHVRTALLVLQGALSVVLLVGAALFVKSLSNVRNMRMGYDENGVLLVYRNLRGMQTDSVMRIALRRALLSAAQAIPGVEKAAYVSSVPMWSTSAMDNLFVAGIDSVRRLGRFTYQTGTPELFEVMGTRILRGRGLTDADREGTERVAVVSEAMAGLLWPGRDAIGQCMRLESPTAPCTTIVGIAENIVQQYDQLSMASRYMYYLPIEQFRSSAGSYLVLRMHGEAERQIEPVRKALQPHMPGQSYVTVRPLREVLAHTRSSWQLGATMFVAFGALALIVAAVGLYSVIAYTVAQRMHELGVRVALGAQSSDIMRLIVGQAMVITIAGVGVGALLAYVASRWLQPLLFQQSARDPLVYGMVAALLLLVGVGASAAPAIRASRADPNSALRTE
jgi:putative ABC transport system permease protein